MAIRDIVTRGFGNGTYNPGVLELPTRGYTQGVVTPSSPCRMVAGSVYHAGMAAGDLYHAGMAAGDLYHAGMAKGTATR
jgi:hypothetical protein